MKSTFLMMTALAASFSLATSASGQGAALQGIANTAEQLGQKIENSQDPILAGPVDKSEKVSPGKIDPDAPREFTKTDSGLQYRILRESDKDKPKVSSTVVAQLQGLAGQQTDFRQLVSSRQTDPISAQRRDPRMDRRHAVDRRRRHDRT